MKILDSLNEHRSWLMSAGIAVLVAAWLLSGQFGDTAEEIATPDLSPVPRTTHTSVRVRTQTAEEIMRTIVVNGKTAPARIVDLAVETDGRVEFVGVQRGASVRRGEVIVRLDERDRPARLAQAEATVKQRQVEYEGREKLMTESYVSEAQLQEAIAQLEAAKTELTDRKSVV